MEYLNAGAAPSTRWVGYQYHSLLNLAFAGFFVCMGGTVTEYLKTVSPSYGSLANQLLERGSKVDHIARLHPK